MALREDYTSHTRAIANAKIALRTDGPGDISSPDNSTVISTNPKLRKRIKNGCFTCRKLRIECSEERPTCGNCRKSKRQCEGYSQRVISKSPIENWPHHPGHVRTIQYYDPVPPDTLTSVNKLALLLQAQDKYKEAEKLNRQALEGREKKLGVHHLNTLTSINNLVSVLQDQGKYEEAEKLNRRALEGYEKVLGVHHRNTLTSVSKLAVVLRYQRKYEEAEKLNRRALEGREKELGLYHPKTLTSINNLASVLQDQGKYEEAEKLNRRAVEGYKKVLGVYHLNTLTSVSKLAVVLRYQRKYEEAEKLNRQALEGREKKLGVHHLNTLTSINNLSSVLQDQRKYEEAEKLNRRALEGREKKLGVHHPNTLTSVSNLAVVLRYQGKYKEAEKLNRRALEGREKKLGVYHPYTLTSVINLAIVLRYQGKYEEAEKLNRRELEGREKGLGVNDPYTLTSVINLAIVLQDQRKYEEAEKLNRRALESFEKELGVHHPKTLTVVNNLAVVLKYQGKYKEAQKLNQRALEEREKELGVHHPDTRNQPLRRAEPNKQSQESPFTSIQPRLLSNYEFSHAKESFVERCPGCYEAWVQPALEPSAWSRRSPVVSVRDPMQDLRPELDGDKLYKKWAERHSRCPLPSPQPKDHQMHDKGKPEQLNLTALKYFKDLSAVVQSTEPYSSESDHLDVVDGSSDDQDIDCLESIVAQKEHTLNKLMLCVYEIFTCIGSFTGHGNESIGSSDSIKRTGDSSTKAPNDRGRKRSRDDKSEQSDGDDGKKESRKHPKSSDKINSPGCKTVKKFACPYNKHNPDGAQSSGACCGPGWDSVHRIKYNIFL
jgi:tetratricopeptide (TPR) repeat protein